MSYFLTKEEPKSVAKPVHASGFEAKIKSALAEQAKFLVEDEQAKDTSKRVHFDKGKGKVYLPSTFFDKSDAPEVWFMAKLIELLKVGVNPAELDELGGI